MMSRTVPTLFIAIAQIEACPPMASFGGALRPLTLAIRPRSTGAINTVTVAPATAVTVIPNTINATVLGNARNAEPAPSTATQRQAPVR